MEKHIKLSDALKVCRKWNKACFESNDAKGQRCAEAIEDEILELPGGVVGAFPYVEKVEVILKENSVGLKVRLSNDVCYGVFRSNGKEVSKEELCVKINEMIKELISIGRCGGSDV